MYDVVSCRIVVVSCNVKFVYLLYCLINVLSRYVVRRVCFFQAEDGIRDLVRSRGLGDVYKRQRDDQPAQGHLFADLPRSDHPQRRLQRHGKLRGVKLSLIHI